ncbi:MAG: 4-hydroxy-tetrahydrodipicolinate synthase [Cucumibacter sp.]
MFRGSFTALITPFRDGALDEDAFVKFIDWQIREGSDGLVPVGTTGESPTLSHDEHCRVIELCVNAASKRVPVIAGAGSNSTREAVEFTRFAEKAGADAVLSVTGYYNKPNPAGLMEHYRQVCAASKLPVFLYNIPPRTVIDINVETMMQLVRAYPTIVGVKDACMDLGRVTAQRMVLGEKFIQLSGEDMTALAFNAQGGVGCISVTANIAPKLCAALQKASLAGDAEEALKIHDRLAPLHRALFLEPNPGGVKYAASKLGLCANELRSPLVPVSEPARASIDKAMASAGLL